MAAGAPRWEAVEAMLHGGLQILQPGSWPSHLRAWERHMLCAMLPSDATTKAVGLWVVLFGHYVKVAYHLHALPVCAVASMYSLQRTTVVVHHSEDGQ